MRGSVSVWRSVVIDVLTATNAKLIPTSAGRVMPSTAPWATAKRLPA